MNSNSSSTSLQNLNDIVVPATVSWWPVAPGWYILAALAMVSLVFFVYRNLQDHKKNRYRKLALRELTVIRQRADFSAWQELPVLLKRTALSTWPRAEVAAMSGTEWHCFLDRTAETDLFTSGAGAILEQLAYGGDKPSLPPEQDLDSVVEAAEFWLRHHDTSCQAGAC